MRGWKDVIIEDAAGRRFTGRDASQFVKTNLPEIWRDGHRNTIWLVFNNKDFIANAALTLLEKALDPLGAKLTRNRSSDRSGTRTRIRREQLNTFGNGIQYELEFQLGDVDLLFEPVGGGDPWTQKGVQQRLQALGYLYPLGPSRLTEQAKKCWEYYARVQGVNDNAALLELLHKETKNNILASGQPVRKQIFPAAQLPAPGDFAALRFPGAYACTYGEGKDKGGPDIAYQFKQGDDQFALETLLVKQNDPMGKIPLVATVTKILPSGRKEPAAGVKVYFQLLSPDLLPDGHPLAGAPLRTTVMDYSVDAGFAERWEPDPRGQLSADEWLQAKILANQLWQARMAHPSLDACDRGLENSAATYAEASDVAGKKMEQQGREEQAYTSWVGERVKNKYPADYKTKVEKAEAAGRKTAEASKIASEIEGRDSNIKKWVGDSNKLRTGLKMEPHPLTPPKVETPPLAAEAAAIPADPAATPPPAPSPPGSPSAPGAPPAPGPPSPPGLKLPPPPVVKVGAPKLVIPSKKPAKSPAEIEAENREKLRELDQKIDQAKAERDAKQAQFDRASREAQELNQESEELTRNLDQMKGVVESTPEAAAAKVPLEDAKREYGEAKANKDTAGSQFDDQRRACAAGRKQAADGAIDDLGKSKDVSPVVAAAVQDILQEGSKDLKEHNEKVWYNRVKQNPTSSSLLRMLNSKKPGEKGAGEIPNAGPARFVRDTMQKAAAVAGKKDPQRRNVPQQYGGKCGLPVPGNIFAIQTCPRFNDGHGEFGALPVAQAAEALHPHSVSALTNGNGYSGAIFLPSRCGGDSYRIRAFLDPELVGKGKDCPSQDTGTMVVWRNIRIGRYYRKQPVAANQANLSDDVKEMLTWPATHEDANPAARFKYNGTSSWDVLFRLRDYASGLVDINFGRGGPQEPTYKPNDQGRAGSGYRSIDLDFPSFDEAFRQCYCEVVTDTDRIETLPDALHSQCIDALRTLLQTDRPPDIPANLDWQELIFNDGRSTFFVNLRHWAHYNARKGPGFAALGGGDTEKIKSFLETYGAAAMMKVIAEDGLAPGLILVQAELGDSWDKHAINDATVFSSGIGTQFRGAFVFYTDGVHRSDKFPYSATSNVVHELGHVLMGNHQAPVPGGDKLHHQQQPNQATQPTPDEVACVMGYMGCYGEFCGRCNLRMRGWKTMTGQRAGGV